MFSAVSSVISCSWLEVSLNHNRIAGLSYVCMPPQRAIDPFLSYAVAFLNRAKPPTVPESAPEIESKCGMVTYGGGYFRTGDGARPRCRNCESRGCTCQWGLKASFHPSRTFSLPQHETATLEAIEDRQHAPPPRVQDFSIIDETEEI
ncbi:hypothetical protein KXW37_009112, partial [Aspergillus fumigatus]